MRSISGGGLSGERYMPISEGKLKIMSRKQRKHPQESLTDVAKEDCALWSILGTDQTNSEDVASWMQELLDGSLCWSCYSQRIGGWHGTEHLPPTDVIYDDRYNLLKEVQPRCSGEAD